MDYFAYGVNLNREQMRKCCPGAKPKFTAVLPNYKLIFSGWSRTWHGGTVSIKPYRGERVAGAVYDITEKDIQKLDRYEGCPSISERISVLLIKEDGEAVKAFTYAKRNQSDESKPAPEYMAIIRKGYRDWELE